ncbi:MAG: cupin domain-containing protein [Polyangiales bacterium]
MAKDVLFDLERLIHPVTPEEFFAEYWEKKPLHIRRNDPKYFEPLLSLREIDRVITTLGLEHPRIEMTDAKKRLTPAEYTFPSGMIDVTRLYQKFADGATIILPQLHDLVPELAHLCRAMEQRISARFQTNIYLTPGGDSQGFKTHYDSHDVFVLQVSGTKHWRVYDTPVPLPYRGQHFDPNQIRAGEISAEFDIQPGDTYYLPRGLMHDAQTAAGGSLHITLGVLHSSWTDLLVEALAQVGLKDPAFRKGLPPGFARPGFDRAEAREFFKDLLRRFAEQAEFDPALDYFAADLVSTRHPLIEGQMEQVMRLDSLSVESRVGARPNLLFQFEEDGERVAVAASGREIVMPAHASEPLRFALATKSFRVGDMPGELDDQGKLVLARRLILEGMVHFVD